MRVVAVFARFYKSFNYDYLRRSHPRAKPLPWEYLDGVWHPYVRVSIEPSLTTVVGANESGKSHLLSAIEKALTGKGLERSDFCRYSPLFGVRRGQVRLPDLGLELSEMTAAERGAVGEIAGLEPAEISRVIFLRDGGGTCRLVVGDDVKTLDDQDVDVITASLPVAFRIDSEIALPSSVALAALGTRKAKAVTDRASRANLLELLFGNPSEDALRQTVPEIASALKGSASPSAPLKQRELARKLLLKVADVAPSEFDELEDALLEGKDGYANGLIDRVNREVASALNFPRHWVQDRDFRLVTSPREYELALTIRDRTETEYTFGERSQGLQYFLSYYVQLLAHEPPKEGRGEILLMDEPDSYLSSEGQRDLLRILSEFAEAATDAPRQVLYVTHSPFLIDRNHAERIRVLDKGNGDEGTRVVHDAGRNHYEPLRSALGLLAGEAVFIGNGNLVVEGQADQVLLAGLSRALQRKGASRLEVLDLNEVTIVPAGGADHVPYVVRLARGRDVDQPAVVALLDSDSEGSAAAAELKGNDSVSRLLPDDWILQVGDIAPATGGQPTALEDTIPVGLAARAAAEYSRDLLRFDDTAAATVQSRATVLIPNLGVFQGASKALAEAREGAGMAKLGFARALVSVLDANPTDPDVADYLDACRPMVAALSKALSDARAAEQRERATARFGRRKKEFAANHPDGATRDDGRSLVVELLRDLRDLDTAEAERLSLGLAEVTRRFRLDEEPRTPIDDFDAFLGALSDVQYAPRRAAADDLA